MSPVIFVVILVGLLLMVVGSSVIRRKAAAIRAADATQELRLRILRTTPEELGLTVAADEPFAIVMDIAYPEAVASVVSVATGDASVYLSNGGAVIGGIQHEAVRAAALSFVREAAAHVAHLTKTADFPYPSVGEVCFYVATPEGSYTARAEERALHQETNALYPLYAAGQNVISALRETRIPS